MAVSQPSLRGTRAGAPLDPLLLTLGWPGGEHGRVNGQRRLPEVFVFESLIRQDPLTGTVGQESANQSTIAIRCNQMIDVKDQIKANQRAGVSGESCLKQCINLTFDHARVKARPLISALCDGSTQRQHVRQPSAWRSSMLSECCYSWP